jgi:hypothetical protein
MSNPSNSDTPPNWLEIPADSIAPQTTAILTEIDTFVSGKLSRLGLLRYNAKLSKIELVELVKQHGESSRKSFENAKPYQDVLCAIASFLPQSAYESLTYRDARELSAALESSKKNAVACAAVEKRLKASKFGRDWSKSLAKLATSFDTPASDTPASDTPASDTPASDTPASDTPASDTPASDTPAASNIVALPDSGPMNPAALIELVKEKLRAMPDKSREIARGMLARLVNEPEKLAELLAA